MKPQPDFQKMGTWLKAGFMSLFKSMTQLRMALLEFISEYRRKVIMVWNRCLNSVPAVVLEISLGVDYLADLASKGLPRIMVVNFFFCLLYAPCIVNNVFKT